MKKPLLFLALLGVSAFGIAGTRVSPYDFACVDANGDVLSSHQRYDTALDACQARANADGQSYFVWGGRYRIDPMAVQPTIPGLTPYITDPDFEYISVEQQCARIDGEVLCDSIHPYAPPGSEVRVKVTEGTNVQVSEAGSVKSDTVPYSITLSYKTAGLQEWTAPRTIAWQ